MGLLKTSLLSLLLNLAGAQLEPAGWTYDTQSTTLLPPAEWGTRFEACGGQRQSPVLLSAATTEACSEQEPIAFTEGNCTYSNLVATASKATWGEISLQGCETPQIQVPNTTTIKFHMWHVSFYSSHLCTLRLSSSALFRRSSILS
jgi:Eukaryotic-type carbonic anhydrase